MEKPTSAQRKYQKRMRAQGRCVKCGEVAWREGAAYCDRHHEDDNERWRRRAAERAAG